MHPSTIILIAFFTSALTATGTVFVLEQYDVFKPKAQAVAEAVVPDLRGMTDADARSSTNAAHLTLVATREPAADAKAGTVIRQSMAAGLRVASGTALNVVLAEEVAKVPKVSGLTVAEATQRLEQQGYSMQVGAPAPDPSVSPGLIVGQMPKADSPYTKGGMVVVQVSSGPGEVDMPKLIGTGFNQAKAEVEKLGLKAVFTWSNLPETPTYIVLSQKPAAGTQLKPGGEVVLGVNR
jgi:serine/threonine-protein kinase